MRLDLTGSREQVVIPKAPLSDGNWVVLQSNRPVIVEQRNPVDIVGSLVLRLLIECHVVLAERVSWSVEI